MVGGRWKREGRQEGGTEGEGDGQAGGRRERWSERGDFLILFRGKGAREGVRDG